ncbi:MAG TPA: hypothetical protein DEH78_14815 [Solibacterales bacterium]|nr:hypothetical protein [Bryobacterales bacterium]
MLALMVSEITRRVLPPRCTIQPMQKAAPCATIAVSHICRAVSYTASIAAARVRGAGTSEWCFRTLGEILSGR